LAIEGVTDAWLATIADRVLGVLKGRKNKRDFLHRAFVYDAGMMLFGVPAGLYLCWKAAPSINACLTHGFSSGAAYVYVIFVVLWIYRILFGYTKWAFPTMEIEEDKAVSARHRRWWYAILAGLVSALIYDVLKGWAQ
jgi:hypothetical protein